MLEGPGLLSTRGHHWYACFPTPRRPPEARNSSVSSQAYTLRGSGHMSAHLTPIPQRNPPSRALCLSVWWREVSGTFLGPQFPFLLSSPVNSFFWTLSSIIHLPTPLPAASSVTSPSFHKWTLSIKELPSLPRNSCFLPCITHLSKIREHRDLAPRTK